MAALSPLARSSLSAFLPTRICCRSAPRFVAPAFPSCLRPCQTSTTQTPKNSLCSSSTSDSSCSSSCSSPFPFFMEQQFEEFRSHLEESGAVREKLRCIVSDLDNTTRLMHAQLLVVHHSRPTLETLDRIKVHIDSLRSIYAQLADVIKDHPGQYYRYHDHWRSQTYTVVFLLAFLHWLETGGLISHKDIEAWLELKQEEFGIDLEDYLVGLCNFSNELPRYVVNQVTAGDYDCPRRVSVFLSDLYAAFRILNLRNDVLRKRFDAMKYDLKRVEEVLYDVKIRGLLSGTGEHAPADRT